MTRLNSAQTFAIVLGDSLGGLHSESTAAQYEHLPALLKNSSDRIYRYLKEPDGLSLDKTSCVNLFDDHRSATEQLGVINEKIRSRKKVLGRHSPMTVLTFFIGHATSESHEFNRNEFVLASSADNQPGSMLHPAHLSRALVNAVGVGGRYVMFLDCCYARAVMQKMNFDLKRTQDGDAAQSVVDPVNDPMCAGAVGLVAALDNMTALGTPEDEYTRMTTMFFSALEASNDEWPSLKDILKRMIDYRDDRTKRERETGGQWSIFDTPAPDIHVQHKARDGSLYDLAPFRKVRPKLPDYESPNFDPSAELSVLLVEPEIFGNVSERNSESVLQRSIASVKKRYEDKLLAVSNDDREKITILPPLNVAAAFNSEQSLVNAITSLAKADVVVFDVTLPKSQTDSSRYGEIQPGMMMLLGMRAVLRRGVSICTVDYEPSEIYRLPLPFNLQYVNLTSHHNSLGPAGAPNRLAKKIEAGLADFRRNPAYLDLPAYDAVRNLGVSKDDFASIPYTESVLYLGPFDPKFQKIAFENFEAKIVDLLSEIVRKKHPRQRSEELIPKLRRLLEDGSSKLVIQSLYEAIRRHNFCIVDWTLLRPNVFFELGAHLVAHESPAVHVMASLDDSEAYHNGLGVAWTQECDVPPHVFKLRNLFDPIVYRPCGNSLEHEVQIMFDRQNNIELTRTPFYEAAAKAQLVPKTSVIRDLANDLRQQAAATYIRNQNRPILTTLYAEFNRALKRLDMARAVGLRVSAAFLDISAAGTMSPENRRDLVRELSSLEPIIDDLSKRGESREDAKTYRATLVLLKGMLEVET